MEYGNDFDFSYGVPDGPTMSSSGSDIFSVIMTVYLLVIVAAVMIGIVKYVFKSIALYRLAQRTGNAWNSMHLQRELSVLQQRSWSQRQDQHF